MLFCCPNDRWKVNVQTDIPQPYGRSGAGETGRMVYTERVLELQPAQLTLHQSGSTCSLLA
jgi:hypothetical protein